MAKRKARTAARSAKDGRFVTKKHAKRHPNTTVVERIRINRKKK